MLDCLTYLCKPQYDDQILNDLAYEIFDSPPIYLFNPDHSSQSMDTKIMC